MNDNEIKKLQKQNDLLTLGLLQEKNKLACAETDIQNLTVTLVALKAENKALKKHIGELEHLSAMECEFKRVKVGGFAWHCADCMEKFDVPGGNTTCAYCKSIKIRQIQ